MEELKLPETTIEHIKEEIVKKYIDDTPTVAHKITVPEDSILLSGNIGGLHMYDILNDKPLNVYDSRFATTKGCISFDKNMNCIVPTIKEITNRYPQVSSRLSFIQWFIGDSSLRGVIHETRFVVIDKVTLVESKGKELKFSHRSNFPEEELDLLQKRFEEDFLLIEKVVEQLRSIISSMYAEEDYDIYTGYTIHPNLKKQGIIKMSVHLVEHDITITNSIELEHEIGNMLVSFLVSIIDGKVTVRKSLLGMRLTHTPVDLNLGYQHSHLPLIGKDDDSRRRLYTTSFCLGGENHMFVHMRNEDEIVTDIDLEGIILAIHDYVRWESLEGGPHIRIESLSAKGRILKTNPSIIYPSNYNHNAVREISNVFVENPELIKPCFKLVNRRGSSEFILNEKKIVSLFTTGELLEFAKRMARNYPSIAVVYDIEKETFHIPSTLTWDKIVEIAEDSIANADKPYINGRYINHTLKIDDEERKRYEDSEKTINPTYVLLVARTYLYHLNKEIENECRKREKEILSSD